MRKNEVEDANPMSVGLSSAEAQGPEDVQDDELLPDGKLVCALTGDQRTATVQEETLQSFVEQLHREYGIALEDMGRDIRLQCQTSDPRTGKTRSRNRSVQLAVFEPGKAHETENIIRVAVIASPATKPDDNAIAVLEEVLAALSEDRPQVFGLGPTARRV